MANISGQENYRVKDFLGYTRLLVFRRVFKPDFVNEYGVVVPGGGYEDCISIQYIGQENKA